MNFKKWMEQIPQPPNPMGDTSGVNPLGDVPMGSNLQMNPMGVEEPPMQPNSQDGDREPVMGKEPELDPDAHNRLFKDTMNKIFGIDKPDLEKSLIRYDLNKILNTLKPVFNQFKNDDKLKNQAEETRQWVKNLQNGERKIAANATIGHLLSKLFGEKIYKSVTGQNSPSQDILKMDKPINLPAPPNQQQRSQEQPVLSHKIWNLPTFNEWKK